MNVLLISANTETINMVPLPPGLNCVAVAARDAGHKVQLLDLMGSGDNAGIIQDVVQKLRPDVIGITLPAYSSNKKDEQSLNSPIPVKIGKPQPKSMAGINRKIIDEILKHVGKRK